MGLTRIVLFVIYSGCAFGCSYVPDVASGIFHLISSPSDKIEKSAEANLECNDGYAVEPLGAGTIVCGEDGVWRAIGSNSLPYCQERTCPRLPQLVFGSSEIEGSHASNGEFRDGANVTYTCAPGFELTGSEKRICKNGVWSGQAPTCVRRFCDVPPPVPHSIVKIQSEGLPSPLGSQVAPGGLATYFCYPGYELMGTPTVTCDSNGDWKPDASPQCVAKEESSCDDCCNRSNIWPHTEITVIQGTFTPRGALPGTVIDIACMDGYRNHKGHGCNATVSRMHCKMGLWVGTPPQCGSVTTCGLPPRIINGFYNVIGLTSRQGGLLPTNVHHVERLIDDTGSDYSIGTNVVYSCRPGYWLRGSSLLVCRTNGCWDPTDSPVCVGDSTLGLSDYEPEDISSGMTLLISVGTACCVVCLLAIVWLLIMCTPRNERQRRRDLRNHLSPVRRRTAPPPPSRGTEDMPVPPLRSESAWPWGLLCLRGVSPSNSPLPPPSDGSQSSADPDRLALIAFADGLQVSLPSYEDAVRERAPPPYDAVVGTFRGIVRSSGNSAPFRSIRSSLSNSRRSRAGGNVSSRAVERMDNTDSISQHSALSGPFWQSRCGGGSIRTGSNAGSIGSLDTVAASEVSGLTGVTHASDATSSSAFSAVSQTPSTRAVCGSLASFDTSSIQNTEGVPLLEESELDAPLEHEGLENDSQMTETGPK